jgi:peptide/nickel transport system substrate-binding protein
MRKKVILLLVMVMLASVALSACGPKAETQTPPGEAEPAGPKDQVVTMAIISTWNTLNIYNTSGNYGNAVADQMFERLVTRTHDGDIEPRLATSWETAPDNLSMTFKLAQNALWHDGQKVTAKDVVFTCKAMTNGAVDNYYRSAFNVLAGTDGDGVAENPDTVGAEAIDDYTVKFTFKEPKDPDSILNSLLSFLYVLPQHILDTGDYASINTSDFWTAPVGAGPFKYVKDTAGESLELEAFTDYYQGSPDFKTLVVRVVPAANLTAGLLNGDIDVVAMGSIPLADWNTVKSSDAVVAASIQDYSYQYMLFNLSKDKPDFQDANVRTAFDMAINKKVIVDQLMLGEGQVAVGPMPQYHPYYNEKLVPNAYDPEKAKALLTESGFNFGKEYLMIVPKGNQVREQSALLIQQDLKKIGVNIKIETYDFATLLKMLREGKSDMGLLGGGSNIDPNESSVILKPDDARNYSLLTDPKWFDLANSGTSKVTKEERKVCYDAYQQALVEDQPYIWLYHQNDLWAYSKRLKDVPMENFVWFNFEVWKWKLAD